MKMNKSNKREKKTSQKKSKTFKRKTDVHNSVGDDGPSRLVPVRSSFTPGVPNPLLISTVVQNLLDYLISRDEFSGCLDIMDRSLTWHYQRVCPLWDVIIESKIQQSILFKLKFLKSVSSIEKALAEVKPHQSRFEASAMRPDGMSLFCQRVGGQMTPLHLNLLIQGVKALITPCISLMSRFCHRLRHLTLTCSKVHSNDDGGGGEGQILNGGAGHDLPVPVLQVTSLTVNYCYVDGNATMVNQIIKACPSLNSFTISQTSSDIAMCLLAKVVEEPDQLDRLTNLQIYGLEDLETSLAKVWTTSGWRLCTVSSPEPECSIFLNFFTHIPWQLKHFSLSTGDNLCLSANFVQALLELLSHSDTLVSLELYLDHVHFEQNIIPSERTIVPQSLLLLRHLKVTGRIAPTALILINALQLPRLKSCHVRYTGTEALNFGLLWQQTFHMDMPIPPIETLHIDNLSLSTANNKYAKYPVPQWEPFGQTSIFQQQPNPWPHLKELVLAHVSHLMVKAILTAEVQLERLHLDGLYIAVNDFYGGRDPAVDWDEIFVGFKKPMDESRWSTDTPDEFEKTGPSIRAFTNLKSLRLQRNGVLTDFSLYQGLMMLSDTLQFVSIQNTRFSATAVSKLKSQLHPLCRIIV